MVGIGTFMEGIDENYIVYEAFYISFFIIINRSFYKASIKLLLSFLIITKWVGEKKLN